MTPRRVGLLGGSFDPPHEGHLWMARRAREVLDLAEVWLLPAWRPPHKDAAAQRPFAERLDMTELLALEEPFLRVSRAEAERGGVSYTIDLLRHLEAREDGDCRFVLIIGGDSLGEIAAWREPEAIFAAAEVAVLAREGFATAGDWPCRVIAGQTHPAQSRLIRADLAAGRRPRWLLPSVADYVNRFGLYRPKGGRP